MSVNILSKSNGYVIVLFSALLYLLLVICGLAIDVGRVYTVKGELQKAADAGALAGAGTIYPSNSSIPLNVLPNPDFSNAETTAKKFVWDNKAAGSNLSDADIVGIQSGYYNLSHVPTDIQPQSITPTGKCSVSGAPCNPTTNYGCSPLGTETCLFQDVPAVQVTLQKSVPTFFAKIFGVNEMNVGAHAISATGPAKGAKNLFPIAVSKCMIDNLFGPSHPTPLPEITIWGPYAGVPNCNTGQWTALSYCSSNSERTINDLINHSIPIPALGVGDSICINAGVRSSSYHQLVDTSIGTVVELPVVTDPYLSTNQLPHL